MLAGDIMPSTSLYRIGDYSIDLAAREIRRGDVSVDVEAKVFDLIALPLDQHDRALSKREINDALWDQRPVTDAALSQLLSKARRALGDDGESQDRPLLQFGIGAYKSAYIVGYGFE
jgi:DNA-binding winged helix-turn-helix (wHTH) protein